MTDSDIAVILLILLLVLFLDRIMYPLYPLGQDPLLDRL